jgi:ceramide glucosyltransferase
MWNSGMQSLVAGLGWILAILSLCGACYAVAAAQQMRRFAQRPNAPLLQWPSVTLLKPLHGDEPGLLANLRSFCAQEYAAPVQIVFGVQDARDRALEAVERLKAEYPQRDIMAIVDGRQHGSNRKVSNLLNMIPSAAHEVLILSDSDIAVPPDYLRRVVAALDRPGVGAATCLYAGQAGAGFWSVLAAMGVSYHFLPNTISGTGWKLASPCVGATIALRQAVLEEIGGFGVLRDLLADDYEIGRRLRLKGYEVPIVLPIVTHVAAETNARDLFAHEIRWSRTIRMLDGKGYAGSVVTHCVPLGLCALALLGTPFALAVLSAALAARALLKVIVDRVLGRRTGPIWLLPLRDLLSFVIFIRSLIGRSVQWRDASFRIGKTGTLSQS